MQTVLLGASNGAVVEFLVPEKRANTSSSITSSPTQPGVPLAAFASSRPTARQRVRRRPWRIDPGHRGILRGARN
ncbi:MAG: hypothetical protein A3F70_11175 [Acidobacteria bacterium RIFCSPLOWO2_12_FULL_67_14]|nr:MAG: hypothetical protein A3H29_16990 [Acidobacteria bacterium RIFCSPLOWO2_02_FULL_67_21]OFW39103.1 MAG: hypothetical protein A3F70_11175 [Acidobacteria bacterium RIFCSPLOWO2_12_FULL_67_14]